MGGLLLACGCFDGPRSAEDPSMVSIRCEQHRGEKPKPGYRLLFRTAYGIRAPVHGERKPKMAIPGKRRRR